MTALDLVAEHERRAGGAVIGARPVVAHAAAELREHQDDHVVRMILLPQVGHERFKTLIDSGPKVLMKRSLTRVRVEAAVVAVEHAGAKVGAMRLSDTLQFAADR